MFDDLVERRIREAQSRGEFENLPGSGKPLPEEDDALVPPELRVAYRVLRNAGYVPPEVEALRSLGALIAKVHESEPDAALAQRARRRLLAMNLALERAGVSLSTQAMIQYEQLLLEKLEGRARDRQAETESPDHRRDSLS